ncbi:MAG: hypothetical protein WAO58_00745 [Fimbriimonadaceae bacterium]
MRRFIKLWPVLLFGLPVIGLVGSMNTALAIPAWARKTKMACTDCHFGGTNKLTLTGREFQARGYTTKDAEIQKEPQELNLGNYISIGAEFAFEANKDEDPSTSFDVEALSIHSGGPLYERFAYFFEFVLHERGEETSADGGQLDTATRSKLAEAYLLYNSNPQSNDFWFARVGQIMPRLIFAGGAGARLGVSQPSVWGADVGDGNLFTPGDRSYGLTAGISSNSGLMVEAGITNGGGGNARPNAPETNNAKDIFASVMQRLDDDGSFVGAYAYKGTFHVLEPPIRQDNFTRFALIGELARENFVLSGAYTWGRNELAAGGNRNPTGYYLEGGFNINPTSTVFARYDNFDPDLATKQTGWTLGWSQRLSSIGRFAIAGFETRQSGVPTTRGITAELNWMF